MYLSSKLHYSTRSLNIASVKRDFYDKTDMSIGYGLKDNMQVVQICKHNVMSAPGGEAAQHRGAVQGVTIQALGDSRASTGASRLPTSVAT